MAVTSISPVIHTGSCSVGFVSNGEVFQEIRNTYSPLSFGNFTAFVGINNAGLIDGSVLYQGTSDGFVFLPTTRTSGH